jgi:hypothetical protein
MAKTTAAKTGETAEITAAREARNVAKREQRKAEKAYELTAKKTARSAAKKKLDALVRAAAEPKAAPEIDERVQALGEERGGFTGRDTPELEDMRWLEEKLGRMPNDAEISLFTVAMMDGAKAQLAQELYGSDAQEPERPEEATADPLAEVRALEAGLTSEKPEEVQAAYDALTQDEQPEAPKTAAEIIDDVMAPVEALGAPEAAATIRGMVADAVHAAGLGAQPDVAPEQEEAPAPASSPKPAISAAAQAAVAGLADELESPEAIAELEGLVRSFSEISLRERAAALAFAKVRGAEGGDDEARGTHNSVMKDLRAARATLEERGAEICLRASFPEASDVLRAAATYVKASGVQRVTFNEFTKAGKNLKAKPEDDGAIAWEKRARAEYNDAYSGLRVARTRIEEACGVRSTKPASAPVAKAAMSRGEREELGTLIENMGPRTAIRLLQEMSQAHLQRGAINEWLENLPRDKPQGNLVILVAAQFKLTRAAAEWIMAELALEGPQG